MTKAVGILEANSETVDWLCQACDGLEASGHDPNDVKFGLALCLSICMCQSKEELESGIGFRRAAQFLENAYLQVTTIRESKGNA